MYFNWIILFGLIRFGVIAKPNLIVDMAVCTFSNGQGANWVKQLNQGDKIYFDEPLGTFTLDNSAENYLFLSDISGLAHFYEIARELNDKNCYGLIYSADNSDYFNDIVPNTSFQFLQSKSYTIPKMIDVIEHLGLNDKTSIVYVAGDTRFCAEMNKYFKHNLNWGINHIRIKPFWNPNKKGLE